MSRVELGFGRCVHCLRHSALITRDHVFPKSWYPSNARKDTWKWQIPACRRCNARYGKIEEEMLTKLGLCVDPTKPGLAELIERARRSIDPRAGKSERDASLRWARRQKLLQDMRWGRDVPNQGIYPGLGERWERPPEEQGAVLIPRAHFRRLSEKITRGIHYLVERHYIPPPFVIDQVAVDDSDASPIAELLQEYGQEFAHEPGITVRRAVTRDDSTSSALCIEIWETFKMYAFVTNRVPDGWTCFSFSPYTTEGFYNGRIPEKEFRSLVPSQLSRAHRLVNQLKAPQS